MPPDTPILSSTRENLTPYGTPEYGDNTQYFSDRWGRMSYYDPETNGLVAARDNNDNIQYTPGRSASDATALYQKHGFGGPFTALSTSGANDYNLATELNGGLYIPAAKQNYAPSWHDNLAPGVADARKAVYDNIYVDPEGGYEWADPRLIYAADKLMSPYFEAQAAKTSIFDMMPLFLTGAAFAGLPALASAGAGAGVGAGLSAADIAGLTQMAADAGLTGPALEAFVSSGGASSLSSLASDLTLVDTLDDPLIDIGVDSPAAVDTFDAPQGDTFSKGSKFNGTEGNLSFTDKATQFAKDIWGNPVGKEVIKGALRTGVSALTNGNSSDAQMRAFNTQMRSLASRQYQAGLQTPLGESANDGNPTRTAYLSGSRGAVDPAGAIAAMNLPAPAPVASAAPRSPALSGQQPSQNGAVKLNTRPQMYV